METSAGIKIGGRVLSDKQAAILQQFREQVKDEPLVDREDEHLLRWLVARDFDLNEAKKMLCASLEWRRLHRIDELNEHYQPPEVLVKYFPMGMTGCDKYGCPVYINAFGRTDFRGIFHSVTKREYIRYIFFLGEENMRQMRHLSRETGTVVTQHTAIVDMEHFSMAQATYRPAMEVGQQVTQLTEANYPEIIRRIFFINVPKMFTVLYAMMKPFVHEETLKKISIYGTNADQWKAALLEDIDPSQLPVHYGGTMTDPDGNPLCPSKIGTGGQVPKSYYLSNSQPRSVQHMTRLRIGPGSKKRLEFVIDEASSTLKWEFHTEEGDIAFGIYRQDGQHVVDILASERVESHLVFEEGAIVCDSPGTYIVEFSNSYSYVRWKTLYYSLSVESLKMEDLHDASTD